MHYFSFKQRELYCEDTLVADLVKSYGSPLYVYSARTILEHYLKLKTALRSLSPLICYSVKANSNLSILKLLVSKGAGLDIVSGGELYRAQMVKCQPKRIVYASVGKTDQEIKEAISYGILMFNVESIAELNRLEKIAFPLKKKIRVALRLNPDVNPDTHEYITTGKKDTKFGMDYRTVRKALLGSDSWPNLDIAGIHIHIGSQIVKSEPFIGAIKKVIKLIASLKSKSSSLKYLNIGGGLGIVYDNERPQTAKQFAAGVVPLLKKTRLRIILEPGRFIVGNAGILVSKVIFIKDTPGKKFIVVDAAMNDLLRPSLYQAYHKIVPLMGSSQSVQNRLKPADIVGAICESGDFLGKQRKLSVSESEYIAVMGAGAYGFSMSSNYNSRPRAAEVMVKANKTYLIGRRETRKDLIDREIIIQCKQ